MTPPPMHYAWVTSRKSVYSGEKFDFALLVKVEIILTIITFGKAEVESKNACG